MENRFKFSYKVFGYESKYYSSYVIEAKSKEEAFVKFVAQSNLLSFEDAKLLIDNKFGEANWKVNDDVIDCVNPLGSNSTELYEILTVRKLKSSN